MNFEGFKLHSKDENMTHLVHPKGHIIRIAHKALSEESQKALAKVPGYADGGEVEDNPPSPPSPPIEEPVNSSVQNPTAPMSQMSGEIFPQMSVGAPAPTTPPAEMPQQPTTGPTDDYAKALQEQKLGLAGTAVTEGKIGAQNAKTLGDLSSQLSEENARNKYETMDAENEHQQLMQDVKDGSIDPHKYIGNMSTPQKIGTAVGLMLGGFGAALTGGQNPAMQFLQKNIDQDIEAQKANLGKKENLLSANLKMMGNMRDAHAATTANMMGMAKIEMEKQAAAAQDPIAKARLQFQIGQLDQNIAATLAPIKMRQEVMGAMKNGQMDPSQAVQSLVPKEHQAKVFGEIQQAQDASNSEKDIMEQFDKANKENTVGGRVGRLGFTPPSVKALNALFNPLIHDQVGRVNEFEQKSLQDLVPSPGDKEATVKAKREALQQFINHKKSAPTAKGYGIDLNNFQSTTSDPYQKLSPQQKQYADYAQKTGDQTMLRKLGLNGR